MEWKDFGGDLLGGRKVILHTDSAKSYKMHLDGVLHDRVIHCKKRVVSKGKFLWLQPKYVQLVTHKVPGSSKTIRVKAGTQIIDRCWRFLKSRIRMNQHTNAGSKLLRSRLRSAQYEYWLKNSDLWVDCGRLCAEHMARFVQ